MPDESCVPDELTPVEELDNIMTFARVIIGQNSSGITPDDWCEAIIRAAQRVRNSLEEPC